VIFSQIGSYRKASSVTHHSSSFSVGFEQIANMKIETIREIGFDRWDAFCTANPNSWFWHTTRWINYTIQHRPELQSEDHSFCVTHDGKILALIPLILEKSMNSAEFSFSGGPGPAPALAPVLSHKQTKNAIALALEHIACEAKKHGSVVWRCRLSGLNYGLHRHIEVMTTILNCSGFLATYYSTLLLDIDRSDSELLDGMRKGHRSDIKRAQATLATEVWQKSNITRDKFDQYRKMHLLASGRATRPLITFEMMHQWIQEGYAILIEARNASQPVGFALINYYRHHAYYSSSCEDPSCGNIPLGHALQWAALQWLREHGIRKYEIGLQPSNQPYDCWSSKEESIAFFKRGFGGANISIWGGELYFSPEFYLSVATRRMNHRADLMRRA